MDDETHYKILINLEVFPGISQRDHLTVIDDQIDASTGG